MRPARLAALPGAGKLVVGKELAGKLGVPFIDLDHEIEREAGRSVTEIFEPDGEPAFRALAAQTLVKASTNDPAVVACG